MIDCCSSSYTPCFYEAPEEELNECKRCKLLFCGNCISKEDLCFVCNQVSKKEVTVAHVKILFDATIDRATDTTEQQKKLLDCILSNIESLEEPTRDRILEDIFDNIHKIYN